MSWAEWRPGSEPSCNWMWRHCPACSHLRVGKSINSQSTSDWPAVILTTLRLLKIKEGRPEGPEDLLRTLLTGSTWALLRRLRNRRWDHHQCPSPANHGRKAGGPFVDVAAHGNGEALAGFFLRTWHLIAAHCWMDQNTIRRGVP